MRGRRIIVRGLTWVAAFVAVGLLVMVIKTIQLRADYHPGTAPPPPEIDTAAVRHLAEAVRIPTVSLDSEGGAAEHFQRLHALMRSHFPRVFEELTVEIVSGHSLLLTWTGQESAGAPIILLGHLDVVPVETGTDKDWTHPPFSGRAADGYIWGRGSLDDKASVWAQLEAIERLLGRGFTPPQTIYFAFGHDEETGGTRGALQIAALLKDRGVRAAFTLDEGGAITRGLIGGVDVPVATVMVGEKGYVSLQLTAKGDGGHSSTPSRNSAIGRLARGLARLDTQPLPAQLIEPVGTMLDQLAPHMGWLNRFFIANRWLFEPLLLDSLASSRTTNALIRTTTAPTMLRAGVKDNVLPSTASATVNFRILPGQTIESVTDAVRGLIDDPAVTIEPIDVFGSNPPPLSDASSAAFMRIRAAIHRSFPEAVVASGIILATTDNRHYAAVRDNAYYFAPFDYTADVAERIHGINERIAVPEYLRMINFYETLLMEETVEN